MKFISRHRVLAAVLTTVLTRTMYFTGYAFMGHSVCSYREPQSGASDCGFCYPRSWEAKLFIPAAAIESFVCKRNIVTGTKTEATWVSPVRQTE